MSSELQFFGLIVLLYLYDSSALLFANEAVITGSGGRSWHAQTGWTGYTLAGRTLCVLNPFTPHRPAVRLSWQLDGSERITHDGRWLAEVQRLETLAPFTALTGVALFLLLPLALFTSLRLYALVPAVALFYLGLGLALRRLRKLPGRDGETAAQFGLFAFECLACPPFGVNLLRRRTLTLRIAEPLPIAAVRLLDAHGWEVLKLHCHGRLDEALDQALPDSEEEHRLESRKQWLASLERDNTH